MTTKQEERYQQGSPPTRPGSQGFTGTLNLELPDLLQMLCLSGSDNTISVVSSCGKGLIWMKGGRICHAQAGEIDGEPAFFEIIRWKDGCFDIGPFQPAERDSIFKGWEHLLIEGIRQGDEEHIAEHSPAGNGEAAGPDNGVGDEQLARIFEFFDELAPEDRGQKASGSLSTPVAETRKVRVLDRRGLFLFLAAVGAHPHARPCDRSCREGEKRARVSRFSRSPWPCGPSHSRHPNARHAGGHGP